MTDKTIYLSIPIAEGDQRSEIILYLSKLFPEATVDAWKPGTHYSLESTIDKAGVVFFHLNDNLFNAEEYELTSGIKSEMGYCYDNQIPYFGVYFCTSDQQWRVYRLLINWSGDEIDTVRMEAGTTGQVIRGVKSIIDSQKYKAPAQTETLVADEKTITHKQWFW